MRLFAALVICSLGAVAQTYPNTFENIRWGGGAKTIGQCLTWNASGQAAQQVCLLGGVTSTFGRTGVVVAVTGDYTAAQVTNAVDSTATYSNPGFISALAYAKLTGVPSTFTPSAHNHVASEVTAGLLAAARGGLGADASGFSGVIKMASGVASVVTGTSTHAILVDGTSAAFVASVAGTALEIASTGGTTPVLSLPAIVSLAGKTFRVPNSATLPATCAVGDVYMDTDATSGSRWFLCESTNTWAVQGGTGSAPVAGTGINVAGSTVSIDSAVTATRAQATTGTDNSCTSTTGTTTVTCSTVGNALPAYTDNMALRVKFTSTCGATPTLNVSTLGAKRMYAADGTSDPTCTAGVQYPLIYDVALNAAAGGWRFPGGGSAAVAFNAAMWFTGAMSSGSGNVSVGANNRVNYYPFMIQVPTLMRYYKIYTNVNTGTIGFGIMDSACNVVTGSKAQLAAALGSIQAKASMSAAITLQPGKYFLAYTGTLSADGLYGTVADFNITIPNVTESGATLQYFYGSEVSSAAVIPNTCGTRTVLGGDRIIAVWGDNQ